MANVPTYMVPEKNFSSVLRPALGQSELAPSLRTVREPPAARDKRGIDSGFVQAKTSASASRPATASFAASIGAPLMVTVHSLGILSEIIALNSQGSKRPGPSDTTPGSRMRTMSRSVAADRQPQYAYFASRMIQAGKPTVLDGAGDAYHVSGLAWRRGYGAPAAGRYGNQEEVFSPCAAAALYRRDAFEASGGFDEDFFCYLEDVDLGFRLRLAGYQCLYVPDALVHHVGSATTGKDSDFAVYHGHRNLVWTYVKNMPGPLFWLYLPLHLAANIYIVARYALMGRWRVILKAKWDAIKGLPKMWRKRKEIQARRVVSAWEIRRAMEKGLPRIKR